MTLIAYKEINFKPPTQFLIDTANTIIEEYEAEGYTLTLRQLYYQFVARDLIPNSDKSYDRLGTAVSKGRNAGLISWDAIEDRTRNKQGWHSDTSVEGALRAAARKYRLDPWMDQEVYVEIWVEKEALAGVIQRIASKWHCPYLSCRGYMSQSEMWAAGQRFGKIEEEDFRAVTVLHLGDHDPSGMDMTRDNEERLELYAEQWIDVRRLALNMDQIEELRPPPNPAKVTDSRAGDYISRFGRKSWELDALEPSFIDELISNEIESIIDRPKWDETMARQKGDIERINQLVDVAAESA